MMRRFVSATLLLLVAAVTHTASAESPCARIISLAPSVTEVVYALGLGPQVIGVTRFCRYPPEAQSVPKVGGFYDVSVEEIVRQKPSQVFALRESGASVEGLRRFGIPVIEVDHSTVAGIKESITRVAATCGVESVAKGMITRLVAQEEEIRARCSGDNGTDPTRVMVVAGRTREGSLDSGVYISGRDGFYSDVLALLGATNVHTQATISIPSLSGEGIRSLAPDAILEIINVDDTLNRSQLMSLWNRYPSVPAVRNKKVFLVDDDFASIPGPRYILLAQNLSKLLCSSH
jgi:iron complex transport system substrate-binding protein